MKRVIMLAVGLAGISIAGAATAKPMEHDGKGSATAVSGYSGTTSVMAHKSPLALAGIAWGEFGDKPCRFSGFTRTLANLAADNEQSESRNMCKDRVDVDKGVKKVSVGSGYLVTGISICTNNIRDTRKRRLKGIKLFASKVGSDPIKITSSGVSATAKRDHCDVWHKRVNCPANTVAYGYSTHEGDRGISGIELWCVKLKHTGMLTRPK